MGLESVSLSSLIRGSEAANLVFVAAALAWLGPPAWGLRVSP